MLPLETKNIQKEENRRLRFIKSRHMQQCNFARLQMSLRKRYSIFEVSRIGSLIPKRNKNIICTKVKFGETFMTASRHLTPAAANKKKQTKKKTKKKKQ